MLFRMLALSLVLFSNPAFAGWQAFKRSAFNTDDPWSYKPDSNYIAMLRSEVLPGQVALLSPYAVFGFSAASSCQADWRWAWNQLVGKKCNWNEWGPVNKICSADLIVVLPCENEILGLSPNQLKDYSSGIEDFLTAENERNASANLRNAYVTIAFEKTSKIYFAYHKALSDESKQAYINEVSSKLKSPLTEELLILEKKRAFIQAYDQLSVQVKNVLDSEVLANWTNLNSIHLPAEKLKISEMNQNLSEAMNSKVLTWDQFRRNEISMLSNSNLLDTYLMLWETYQAKASDLESSLSTQLNSFQTTYQDMFWMLPTSETAGPALGQEFELLRRIQNSVQTAKNRSESLRKYKKTYQSSYRALQDRLNERIALNEKNLYVEARKELEQSQAFSTNLTLLTAKVYQKPQTIASIPLLESRYQTLKEIISQDYQCKGALEKWKESGCELANKNIAIAKREIDSLRKTYFKLYLKLLLSKTKDKGIDSSALIPYLNEEIQDFDMALRKFDGILRTLERSL